LCWFAAAIVSLAGCIPVGNSQPGLEAVWGEHGFGDGEFYRPRAVTIDKDDNLYIVDMTARIQVFTRKGEFLRGWKTPISAQGKPSGLAFARDGTLMVADTHYFRVLFYTPEGKLLPERTIGGVAGFGPGEFNFVTDAIQDSKGNYYVAEYGEYDRIQKFSSEGEFLLQWGGHGDQPGQFMRPQKMDIDGHDRLFVTDACNHRIQIFDVSGDEPKLIKIWGEQGAEPGKLCYPYDLLLDGGGALYVCEFGNHRVQKFTLDGRSLGCWGSHGRREGEFHNPWGLALDSRGSLHVLDTYNHRVQRIRL
jgi:DNA-binding beta-propeller fold protein YncE